MVGIFLARQNSTISPLGASGRPRSARQAKKGVVARAISSVAWPNVSANCGFKSSCWAINCFRTFNTMGLSSTTRMCFMSAAYLCFLSKLAVNYKLRDFIGQFVTGKIDDCFSNFYRALQGGTCYYYFFCGLMGIYRSGEMIGGVWLAANLFEHKKPGLSPGFFVLCSVMINQ